MREALAAGVVFYQYRSKNAARRTIYEVSARLAGLARDAGAVFIVNDHADIAAAAGADGVHLGQEDLPVEYSRKLLGPGKIIGVSTHSVAQARTAQAAGADYIGFGPIFRTQTKDAGQTRGTRDLPVIKQAVDLPVIAIGGINAENALSVVQAGADGVAVISAVLAAPELGAAAERLIGIVKNVRRD